MTKARDLSIGIPSGLVLITPTSATGGTVGPNGGVSISSGVSTLQLNGVFSTTYDSYRVVLSNINTSAVAGINFRIGDVNSNTGYYQGEFSGAGAYAGPGGGGNSFANGTQFGTTLVTETTGQGGTFIEIHSPFQSTKTTVQGIGSDQRTGGAGARFHSGFLNNSTSYTGLYLAPGGANFTSGHIAVYGYRK